MFRRELRSLGRALVRLGERRESDAEPTLRGDRDIEWSWVAAKMPDSPGRVLDFGPATSPLSLIAAFRGGDVVALDLMAVKPHVTVANIRHETGDILSHDFGGRRFDTIINCSTVEHVGLPGRYGGTRDADGDLKAMAILRDLFADGEARMVLTVPVGRDGVYEPYHRVYGAGRLPMLLDGFEVAREAYFAKDAVARRWQSVARADALAVQGSASFYALGLFVLALPQ